MRKVYPPEIRARLGRCDPYSIVEVAGYPWQQLSVPTDYLQGYLAHNKTPSPRTLQ